MSYEAYLTLAVVAGIFACLFWTRLGPDLVILAGLSVLFSLGVIDMRTAFAGFSNEGMLTVAVLFVVAAGLRDSGALSMISGPFLGRPHSVAGAQWRMMAPVAAVSAFLNNTTVVAMFVPVVLEWAKKYRISPSKVMIPLSYAAILGGLCSLIGTSTNVVVNGLMISQAGMTGMGMFEITKVGLPMAAAGIVFFLFLSRWILPDRKAALSELSNPREYTVEMTVNPESSLVGQTIEAAGLRHLPGMYLMEIERDGNLLVAVDPKEKLRGGDRLVFVGIVESVVDLQKIRGLTPAGDQIFKLDAPRAQRRLIEAVVSDSNPLIGKTIRESRFRSVYNSVVIAVARNGQRIRKKIGDIELRVGDTLLLETLPSFADQQRNSRDFYLVSPVENSRLPSFDRAWISLAILAALVVTAAFEWLSMFKASLLGAGLMVACRCVTWTDARRAIEWPVLIAIAASFGIGKAIESSGLAGLAADGYVSLAGNNPWLALAAIYGLTWAFTELLTNNAAAVLAFPLGLAAASKLGVNPMPFIMAVCLAASCGFSSPIGYQTHLMVFGPGGYRASDFLRAGLPLSLLMWALGSLLIPLAWPF